MLLFDREFHFWFVVSPGGRVTYHLSSLDGKEAREFDAYEQVPEHALTPASAARRGRGSGRRR